MDIWILAYPHFLLSLSLSLSVLCRVLVICHVSCGGVDALVRKCIQRFCVPKLMGYSLTSLSLSLSYVSVSLFLSPSYSLPLPLPLSFFPSFPIFNRLTYAYSLSLTQIHTHTHTHTHARTVRSRRYRVGLRMCCGSSSAI